MNPLFKSDSLVSTFWRRFALATILWIIAWPVLWFFKLGEITGPKAWFWIIGELNYPVVAVVYILLDVSIRRYVERPLMVFITVISVIAVCMPFYYERYGFILGVSVEARLF